MKTEDTKTTKDSIIDASFKLFMEKSYDRVTVPDHETCYRTNTWVDFLPCKEQRGFVC